MITPKITMLSKFVYKKVVFHETATFETPLDKDMGFFKRLQKNLLQYFLLPEDFPFNMLKCCN